SLLRPAYCPDLLVSPWLHRHPFNRIVQIFLLTLAHQPPLALGGFTRAAHIRIDVNVTLLDPPADIARFAKAEGWDGRQVRQVLLGGRSGVERGEGARSIWSIGINGDVYPVEHPQQVVVYWQDEVCG